jgi:hypothetical protein
LFGKHPPVTLNLILGIKNANIHNGKEYWDTIGERIGRIGRMETDFWGVRVLEFREKSKKKSVVHPPDPPNPFSHCIPKLLSVVYIVHFWFQLGKVTLQLAQRNPNFTQV